MTARKSSKKATPPKKASRKKFTSQDVNLGHVFALRPRVNSAFRQEDFLTARRLLEGDDYATIEEAAQAVAERALSMTNDPKGRPGTRRGR